jgi:hypothetical protein
MFEISTDWELLKFKHEVLGQTLEDLARENNISLPVLKFNAKDWKQLPLVEGNQISFAEITSLEDIIDKLGDKTSAQTEAFQILKQRFLGPKYIELETVLLHKSIEMAREATDAKVLRSIASILNDLMEHNPLLTSRDRGDDSAFTKKEWKVTFVDVVKEQAKQNKPEEEQHEESS